MSNVFKTFDNLYGNLAQSAYPDTPKPFPFEALDPADKQTLQSGGSVQIDYSVPVEFDGRTIPGGHFKRDPSADPNIPQEGLVYLQPKYILKS